MLHLRFGYINKEITDKMLDVFNNSLLNYSGRQLSITQFNAMDPSTITNSAYVAVTASVSQSVSMLSGEFKDCPIRDFKIVKEVPDWSIIPEMRVRFNH
jgi:hypothetical protein